MSLYKRGATWWGRYNGERKSLGIPTGPDAIVRRKLAEEAFRKWTLEVDEEAHFPGRREQRTHTFREWAGRYLDLPEVKGLRSYKNHVETVNVRLVPFFGDRRLTDISVDDVESIRASRVKKNGQPAALSTVNWDHAVLKAMLNKAMKRGLLTSNPASRVSLPNPHNERDRILTVEEWTALYAEATDHLKPILLTGYRLGLRLGEILALTWDRVDREKGLLTLRAIDTKTKQPRKVPMTADLLITFRELHKAQKVRYIGQDIGQDRVFLRDGEPIADIRTAFANAAARAKVRDFRFHDLRHCAATNLRRSGVDNTTAMSIIGHKSERMWKRYNTIDDADLKAAAAKLNTFVDRAQSSDGTKSSTGA